LNASHRKSNKMLEQELKDIWDNSSRTAQISIDTSQLVEELNAKVNGFQKKIRIRDVREISASVIGILIFSYLLYEIPFPITKLACSFSIIWFAFVIFKFRKSKKQNAVTNLSLSITEQLAYQESAMQQQVVFLNSAAYWYSIPPFITNFIFILGLGNPTDYNWINSIANSVLPLTDNMKVITLIGLAFFYAFTAWLNKRAVTKVVKPLLENIKTVHQQLKKE
jgi:hypothetical protein